VKFRVRHPFDAELMTSAATRPSELPAEAMAGLDAAWEREVETWAGLLVVNEEVLKAVAERVKRLPRTDPVQQRFVAIADNGIEVPKLVAWARDHVKVRRAPKSALLELVVDAGDRETSRDVAGYIAQELLMPVRRQAENDLQVKTRPVREIQTNVNARLMQVSNARRDKELTLARVKPAGTHAAEEILKEELQLKILAKEEDDLRGQKSRLEQQLLTLQAASSQAWTRVFIAGGDANFPRQ
jgi:hypothetical protein